MLRDSCAILLQGGRVLLTFVCGERPPAAGHLVQRESLSRWVAECWQPHGADHWYGVAVLDALPAGRRGGPQRRLGEPLAPRRDAAASTSRPGRWPSTCARPARARREVFGFLVRHLLAECAADSAEAQSHRAFARGFIAAAASHDGFIEIVGVARHRRLLRPGLVDVAAGRARIVLADASEDLALREVEVARLRARRHPAARARASASSASSGTSRAASAGPVFFERDGQLLRLDVVRSGLLHLAADGAREHVGRMLPRLRAPDATIQAFRRVCRPRFAGVDTLSPCPAPIAAACDAVLQAPDGTLLVTGWLLDPLQRVERVLIKSTGNLYAQLDTGWCALPRPDLAAGFAQDPRFAGLLDERDVMHGFIVHVPAARGEIDGAEVYLELVLDDGSCLFRPLTVTPFATGERLPQLLRSLSPAEPELGADHREPSRPRSSPASGRRRASADAAPRPARCRWAAAPATGASAAVMPFRTSRRAAADPRAPRRHARGRGARPRPRHRARQGVGGARRSSARPSPSTA